MIIVFEIVCCLLYRIVVEIVAVCPLWVAALCQPYFGSVEYCNPFGKAYGCLPIR